MMYQSTGPNFIQVSKLKLAQKNFQRLRSAEKVKLALILLFFKTLRSHFRSKRSENTTIFASRQAFMDNIFQIIQEKGLSLDFCGLEGFFFI